MTIVHVSEFEQRRGLKAGAFYQACDFCEATHREYGLIWPVCRECSETCCPDHSQPGTEREDERGDEGTPYLTCVCRRCCEEAQEREAAQTCDSCHTRQSYICLATQEDTGGGYADVRVCKKCSPWKWRRFLESQEDDCG